MGRNVATVSPCDTVHGWAQVEMLEAGGFDGASSAEGVRVPASVIAFLRHRLEQALAAVEG